MDPMLRAVGDGFDLVLQPDATYTLGRDEQADLRINEPRVSRRHATLQIEESHWILHDLESHNGTFHGGKRITRLAIGEEIELRFGNPETGPAVTFSPMAGEQTMAATAATSEPPEEPPDLGELTVVHRTQDLVVRIGRAADNDIVLDDLSVSRYHAELRRRPDGMQLVDKDSFNGTYVNGRQIEKERVVDFDVITIGHHLFRLRAGALEQYVDSGEATFEAIDLSVTTDDGHQILDGVSFALPKNSFLAVVGPSGSGKSTLLGALTAARAVQRGSVLYRGRDLYANLDILRQRFGFVPQDDVLHAELTVRQALEYAAALRFPPDVPPDDRRERVEEVLTELGLDHRATVPILRLSGGQRKRTSVALELLTRPSLLLLDEPTSGLDPGLERSLMRMLRRLADDGRTMIVVTHSTESLTLCDRVLFLAPGGTTAYFGPPRRALGYFDCQDYADVFASLDTDRNTDWRSRYKSSADHKEYVAPVLAREETPASAPPAERPAVSSKRVLGQFFTLTRRYLSVLTTDRRRLLLLTLQAPLLGLILLLALNPGQFRPSDSLQTSLASVVVATLILGVTWLGISNSIREVVKERAVYQRERAVGLSPFAYLASKFVVLTAITAVQAVVFGLIAIQRQDGPPDAVALGWPQGELIFDLAIAGAAAMSVGLLISTLVSSADKAMTLLPLVLVLQLLFVGLFPGVSDSPVLGQMRYAASAQWGFAAAASTVDLNDLEAINHVVSELQAGNFEDIGFTEEELLEIGDDALRGEPVNLSAAKRDDLGTGTWKHESGVWLANLAALGGLYLSGFLLSWLVLVRRDRQRT